MQLSRQPSRQRPLASLLLCLLLALPARAEDPPLDLAPLVPPKAPWLSKQPAPKPAPKPASKPAPKPALPGRPALAKKRGKQKAKPAGVAQEAPLELPAPPLIQAGPAVAPAPGRAAGKDKAELPPPPLLKLTNQIGVLVQADVAQAALETGLQAIAALAPLSQRPQVVPRPAQRCGDDACALSLGKAFDQLVVASLQAGQLRLRVLELASRQRVGDPQQATVKDDEAAATAEALACKLLVPSGCTGELVLTAAPGTRVELDGAAVPAGTARLPVGLHALVARSGGRSTARTIAIVHETPLALSLPEAPASPAPTAAPPPAGAAPVAAIAAAPPAHSSPARTWNKPAGIAVAGAGVLAAGLGVYFGARSSSDLGSAEAAYRTNGNTYRQADAATLRSGNAAAHTANLLFAASAVLAGAGALLVFAF